MKGKRTLQNYEFRLEKKLPNGRRLQSSFIQSLPFHEGEELFFPLEDPANWFNGAGFLQFLFKVRPLTYKQKVDDLETYHNGQRELYGREVEDLEAFCEERLTELSAKRKAVDRDGGDSVGEPSLKKFKDELMEKLFDLKDMIGDGEGRP